MICFYFLLLPIFYIFALNIFEKMKQKTNKTATFLVVITMIFIAAFSRLIPHWANFTAVGAMAIFGGAYLNKKYLVVLVPLLAMWLSDLVLNNIVYASESFTWFHSFQLYTILPLAVVALASAFWLKKISAKNVLLAAVLSTIFFFLVSNFGAWISSPNLYPQTAAGLYSAYVAALPFALNSLAGNVFYSSVLFGAYYGLANLYPQLKLQRA